MQAERRESALCLGTKAETLERLRGRLQTAVVPASVYFEVGEWRADRSGWLRRVRNAFPGGRVAVRSSARIEDAAHASMAGRFTTCLDVDAGAVDRLGAAIDRVTASYLGDPRDQVLVQPMVAEVAVSGVATTRVLQDGGPYYVFNYDDVSGRPDAVTGGQTDGNTVFVYRDTPPSEVKSPRLARWIAMVREVEALFGGVGLDIEYLQSRDGRLHVVQTRRISVERRWLPESSRRVGSVYAPLAAFVTERSARRGNLLGRRTVLGKMPDWNPAEVIGAHPRPLAASLYRRLITDRTWRRARAILGYREPMHEALMVMVGGQPFIDVRNSFNSLLPADLGDDLGEPLVDAWIDRLVGEPSLHDKVEFDVAITGLDFAFDRTLHERYPGVLGASARRTYRDALGALTHRAVIGRGRGSVARALVEVRTLEALQRRTHVAGADAGIRALSQVAATLDACVRWGTLPFAVIARHAFLAEALLRSAVMRGALAPSRLDAFRRSLTTVASRLTRDFRTAVLQPSHRAAFLSSYGHLRAGTYDLLSPRYDQRADLFRDAADVPAAREPEPFALSRPEVDALDMLSMEAGFPNIGGERLLAYAADAITGREYAKFVFSRSISDALEGVAAWGESLGLSREDLAYLRIGDVLESVHVPILRDAEGYFREVIAEARSRALASRALRLGDLIRDCDDLYVVPVHRSAPNFVTTDRIEAPIIVIRPESAGEGGIAGRIACIESGDPGYDWVFTRGVAGLVTRYGGSNSHMAIRCAEFGLPAAIGCGEALYERIVAAGRVEINGADEIVRPIER